MTEEEIQDAIAGHDARNASLKQRLADKRVDLTQPRAIECYFWAGGGGDAKALAEALRSRGFTILVQRKAMAADPDFAWNVEAQVLQSVELTTRREFTDELVRLAAAHNGRYDGWGTRI